MIDRLDGPRLPQLTSFVPTPLLTHTPPHASQPASQPASKMDALQRDTAALLRDALEVEDSFKTESFVRVGKKRLVGSGGRAAAVGGGRRGCRLAQSLLIVGGCA